MKAPKASTGFPWDALADSIRSVTRDIEKEELNEESKRGKTVDETEHASSPAVSKPESDSGGKESSSVDESQGQSGRSADEMPPSRCEVVRRWCAHLSLLPSSELDVLDVREYLQQSSHKLDDLPWPCEVIEV